MCSGGIVREKNSAKTVNPALKSGIYCLPGVLRGLLFDFEQSGHHERLLVEDEHRQCDADHQCEHDEQRGEPVTEEFDHQFVLACHVAPSDELHQGQDRFVSVHARNHRQQRWKRENYGRTVDQFGEQHTEHADGESRHQGCIAMSSGV